MGLISSWIGSVTKPAETFAAEKPNATLGKGMLNNAIVGILVGLVVGAVIALVAAVLGAMLAAIPGMEIITTLGILAIVVMPIVGAVGMIVGSLISAVIYLIFAKIFGKGTFTQQYYLLSLPVVPMTVLSALVSLIPFIGIIISLLLMLYSLYLMTLGLKEAHGYSLAKAVLTWLVPTIIIFVIMAVAVGSIIASLMAIGAPTGGNLVY